MQSQDRLLSTFVCWLLAVSGLLMWILAYYRQNQIPAGGQWALVVLGGAQVAEALVLQWVEDWE